MVSRSLQVIGTFAVSLAAGASALSTGSQTSSTSIAPTLHRPISPAFVRRKSPVTVEIESSPFLTASASSRDVVTMMPATLDRPAVKTAGSGPAVLDRPAVEEKSKSKSPVREEKSIGSEAWEVRIYNDGVNTREFVARCLVQIAGLTELEAYQTMMQAHQNGLAVVGRYPYERAEMYHDALKTNGIMCDLVPVDEEG